VLNKKARTALPVSRSDVHAIEQDKPQGRSTRPGSRSDDWLALGDWLAAGEKIKAHPSRRKPR
jgi:hypothetical protein